MTTASTAPGWYRDGVTPGLLRWFDGASWTDHTAPDPGAQPMFGPPDRYPTHPFAGGHAATATPGHGPSSAVHWMLPVGRSWQSIVAGYLGLFALAIWVLGPVAIGFGVWALIRASSGGHGRGRAITGIVGGGIGTLVLVAFALNATGAA